MSDNSSSEEAHARFKKLASGFQPKLPRKLALLLPHKTQIEELLAMRASYDDIRILMEDADIAVSKDTVYRFCRIVIGRKPVRQRRGRHEIGEARAGQTKEPSHLTGEVIG